MNRYITQRWVAVACLLSGMGGVASATSPAHRGIPLMHVASPVGFVPQVLYVPSRPTPPLLFSPFSISSASVRSVDMGVRSPVVFNVHYSGGSASLNVSTEGELFTGVPVIEQQDADDFKVTLTSSDQVPAGSYKVGVRFIMCSESPCINTLASTSRNLVLSVRWVNVGGWETFQRDARHDGYVPVAIRPSAIRSAWEWQRTSASGGINDIVSSGGKVFVSDDSWMDATSIRALDEATGSMVWHWDFAVPSMNPPAVSGGSVYVATTGQEQTFLYAFAAADGSPKFQATFASQYSKVLAPTVAAGVAYTNGGYFGGGVYAFDASDGLALWSAFSGDDDMTTPAVADGIVYYYDGANLQAYDAFSGTTLASIADPNGSGSSYSYKAAPMVGSPDHVTTFSGELYTVRILSNFSVASQRVRWRTASLYSTQPAVANGVVYAGGNNPKSLDAINEETGEVLWRWVPNPTDSEFHRNVVVTKNLVFVSTDKAVYAIDLVSHKPVWSWPTPGSISISGDGYLFIAEGAFQSNGHLHAFKVY